MSAIQLNALGIDCNMGMVLQETTGSDPAITYELAHRLTAKNGIIQEVINLLHKRPLPASLGPLNNFLFFFFWV